jgi:hypothetical protein
MILYHFKINLTSYKQQIYKSINYIKNTDAYNSVCCRFPNLHKNLIFAHWLNSDIVTNIDDTLFLYGQMQQIKMYQTLLTPQRIFSPQIVNILLQ